MICRKLWKVTPPFRVEPTHITRPGTINEPEVIYPEQREDDMGETSVHINLVANLLNILKLFLKGHEDVFLSANMNLYYEKGDPNKWYAPDILIAFGVPNHERPSYFIWKENVAPQVIFEVFFRTNVENRHQREARSLRPTGCRGILYSRPRIQMSSSPDHGLSPRGRPAFDNACQ